MIRCGRRLCLVAAACLCGACGLLDLGDFELEACKETPTGSPCDELNRERGIADDSCFRYQCRREGPGCEWRAKDSDDDHQADETLCAGEVAGPLDCDDGDKDRVRGSDEICDGKDNDCDSKIDETRDPPPAETTMAFDADVELRFVEAAQVSDGDVYVLAGETQARGSRMHLVVLKRGALEPSESHEHDVAVALADRSGVLGDGACVKTTNGRALGNACGFEEISLAVIGNTVITAGVDTMSSRSGILRAGVLSPEFELRLGNPGQRSQADVGRDAIPPGVQAPRVIAGAPNEALLVWQTLGRQSDADACPRRASGTCGPAAGGCSQTDLRALSLRVQVDANGSLTLDASGDVAGEQIGVATNTAPALARFHVPEHDGYLVAYADGQGVALFSQAWNTNAEGAGRARGLLRAGAEVSQLALARAGQASEDDFHPNAIAWRTGCGARASIQFARLDFSVEPPEWRASSVVSVRSGTNVLAGPWLAQADAGFRQEPQSGGWFVLWIEVDVAGERALMSRRVAELDDEPVGDAVQLASGTLETAFSFTSATGGIRYGYTEEGADGRTLLRTGEASCVVEAR